ncbi:S1 family peptidase [Promicromonospora sukumoe]|uniref:S1 family peptidase n=1 Tax=Promicromonospora sukumoe TaxID=88382 RepID=UPI0037C67268
MKTRPTASRPTTSRPTTMRLRLAVLAVVAVLVAPATAGPAQAKGSDEPTEAELAELHEAIGESEVEGVAWYTDEAAGEVVVIADSTVDGGDRNDVRRAAGDKIGALELQRTEGEFKLLGRPAPAGTTIIGSGVRCTLGFNVRKGNMKYLITAGHCANKVPSWKVGIKNAQKIGPTVQSRFPGGDYALVRYDNRSVKRPGGYTPGNAFVGQAATRVGSTTGQHSGFVTATGVTVRFSGGDMVPNLIQADICAEPGDSGGPLFSGKRALGILSGGTGDCPSGGISFYQPIKPVLAAYGVQLYYK